MTCEHNYTLYVAEQRIPYWFCDKCQGTAYNGHFYPMFNTKEEYAAWRKR